MRFALASLLAFFLCSCSTHRLSVHTDYIGIEDLASFHVRTPDPLLSQPPVGQRLVAYWQVQHKLLKMEDLHLQITIRLGNREQFEQTVPICRESGHYVYRLLNEDYFEKQGILTYKVDLLSGTTLLDRWVHQLWTELIVLEPTP